MNEQSQRGPRVGDRLQLGKNAAQCPVGMILRGRGIDPHCAVVFPAPTPVEIESVPEEWREMYGLAEGPVTGLLHPNGSLTLADRTVISVLPQPLTVEVINEGALR